MASEHAKQIVRCFKKYDPDCFEAVRIVEKTNLIDLLLRVQPEQEPTWLEIVEKTLHAIDQLAGGRCLVGRMYFLKEFEDGTKDMVYGWKVSLSHPKLPTLVSKMAKTFGLVIKRPIVNRSSIRISKRSIGSGKKKVNAAQEIVRAGPGEAPDEMPLPSTRRGPGQKGRILGTTQAEYHPAYTRR